MTDIQEKIQNTIREIVHLEKVSQQLKTTQGELEEAYGKEAQVNKNLDKELRDVEKLEGLSTKAIFYKILGSKEKQIEKERQEYLEATLQAEDLQNEIKLLEYEVNLLGAKIGSKDLLESRLEKLKLQRESEIIQTDPKLRSQLMDLSQKLESQYRLKQELQEAIEVGTVAHNLLSQVINHLSSIRNWGQWPAGQRRVQNVRRQRQAIDRARNLTYQVKHHLNLFDKELQDVGQRLEMNIDTSSFSKFSDFFFNNIITDWILKQQLTTSIGSANEARHYINSIVGNLNARFSECDQVINSLNQNREEILIMP